MGKRSKATLKVFETLRDQTEALKFAPPVTHVYNPLVYAWRPFQTYVERFGEATDRFILLGMNPGPFGMVQTGIPFGEVGLVGDWLGLRQPVDKPAKEHPKRPIQGFDCTRSEVSGARLWGWAKKRFETPERFFEQFFVHNFCPLAFLEEGGRNRTPDKLPSEERAKLEAVCHEALGGLVDIWKPRMIIGVGAFAEKQAKSVVGDRVPVGRVLHPSPASPKANRGWEAYAEEDFATLGIPLP